MPLTTKYKLDEASLQILEQRLHKNGAKLVIIDENIYVEVATKKELLLVESCKPLMKLIDYLQQIQNWNLMFDHDSKHDDPSFGNLVTSYLQVKNKTHEEKLEAMNKKIAEFSDMKGLDERFKAYEDMIDKQCNVIKIQQDSINNFYNM